MEDPYALPTPPIPTALRVVAVLFVISGVLSVLDVIFALFHSRIEFNFGVLGLFIGPGLMRLSRGWRTCALVFLWLALLIGPIMALLLLATPAGMNLNIFGMPAGDVSKLFGLVFLAIMYALVVWEYRVLVRPDIRRLFGLMGS